MDPRIAVPVRETTAIGRFFVHQCPYNTMHEVVGGVGSATALPGNRQSRPCVLALDLSVFLLPVFACNLSLQHPIRPGAVPDAFTGMPYILS